MWMLSAADRERDRVEFLRKHEEAMWEALRPYQKWNRAPLVARARLPTQGAEATRQDDPPRRDQSALKNAILARDMKPAVVVESEDERAEFLRKHEEAMWKALRPYLKGNRVAQAAGAPAPVQGVDALLESKRAVKEQCARKDAEAVTRLQTQELPETKGASFEAKLLSPEASDEASRRVAAAALQTLKEEKANKSQPLFEAPAAFDPAVAKLQATPQRPPPGGPLTDGPPAEARSAPAITREACVAKPALQRRRRYIAPGSSTNKKTTKLLDTVKEESECDFLEEDTGA